MLHGKNNNIKLIYRLIGITSKFNTTKQIFHQGEKMLLYNNK